MDLATPSTLPSGWAATSLATISIIRDDLRQPVNAGERAKRSGPYPYYGATGQVGWIDDYLIDGESVLLGEDGAPFLDPAKQKAYKVVGKAWVNNHAHILWAVDGLSDIRFLLHSLNAVDYRPYVNGTTRLKLTQAAMRQIPINLPPLPEQRRIVAEIERQFSLLDAGVANLKRVQANLKRYRASVLQAACEGRLVPTEAELARTEGRDYEPAAVLLSRILAERRARWVAEQAAKKGPPKAAKSDPFRVKEVLNPQTAVHFQDLEDDASLLNSAFSIDEVDSTAGVHLTFNERASAYDASNDSEGSVVAPLFRNQQVDGPENMPPRLFSRQFRYDQPSAVFKGYKEPAAPDTSTLPPLPEGWIWTSLTAVAEIKGGITKGQQRKPQDKLRLIPYLRVGNVQRGFLDLRELKTIEATEKEIEVLQLLTGDVLFNEGGDRDKLGRGWVWESQVSECIHQNHVFRARMWIPKIEPKFLSWYGNSGGAAYFTAEGKQTTNLASINITKLAALPIPLPPFAEQQRIVAEVERLLSVVDNLEQVIMANLKRADRLRQSILKEAFAGRLVPQDPADEPASALLERIQAERNAQAKAPAKPSQMRPRKGNTNAKPRSNDTAGARVPSGDDQRKRDPASGAWLQPVLFSTDGE